MSGDDILARLADAYESLCDIGGAWERDVVRDAAAAIRQRNAEIDRLQRWKAESITLLKQWNQIADDVIARLDADNTLGLRLPDIVASEIERLRAERDASRLIINDLTAEVERLRAENAEQAQGWRAERALADQLASHLEWALRCVGSLPLALRTTFDARMAEVLAAHKEACRG